MNLQNFPSHDDLLIVHNNIMICLILLIAMIDLYVGYHCTLALDFGVDESDVFKLSR